MLTYGSLFTGAGGLEMGVQAVIPGRTLWHSEIDPGACKVLAHRWPDAPNLGDITTIDWAAVPRVDVLTGRFPCQDVSTAGARAGLKEGTRSGLFHEMMRAIDALRPSLVVIENVRGLLTAQGEPDPHHHQSQDHLRRLRRQHQHQSYHRHRHHHCLPSAQGEQHHHSHLHHRQRTRLCHHHP
jgi:site-specific DNA-cytosine methylase